MFLKDEQIVDKTDQLSTMDIINPGFIEIEKVKFIYCRQYLDKHKKAEIIITMTSALKNLIELNYLIRSNTNLFIRAT